MTDETARFNWERYIARMRGRYPTADLRFEPCGPLVCPSCEGERGIEVGAGDCYHTVVCPTCEGSGCVQLLDEDSDDAE